MNQRASTNWYHPHLMGKTAEHVYMGLAGFLILDDDESDALNLPKEYGVDDIPLAIQDKRFDANGQIDYSPTRMEVRMGYKSDVMMVNGVILPYVDVPAKKVRLRLLNASNASVYNFKFSDNRAFSQIAVDNSFLEKPINMNSISLTPAERAEIIVDLTGKKGEIFTLVDSNSGLDIMQIRVSKDATSSSEVPAQLTTLEKDDINSAVRTRKFVLNMSQGDDGVMHMSINGKTMNMMRIDEYVPENDVEIWEITNTMGMTHNFHIHSTHFFPLTRNGVAVPANEQAYKDVIAMPGNSTVRVLVKMTDFPDENTGYMYHCHFLEHEDDGMMGQFAITDGRVEVNVRGSNVQPVEMQTGNIAQTGTKPDINNVTRLYIATFGRAPDSAGVEYWLYESKLNLEDITRSFFDQEETKAKYPEGVSNENFITSIYNYVYNRDPDQAGMDYWAKELDSNKIDKSIFLLATINGAKGDDALMLEKKTIAGVDFLKSGVQNLAMSKKVIDDIK